MPQQGVHLFLQRRVGQQLAGLQVVADLTKDPRSALGASANHHKVNAGFVVHPLAGKGIDHIAVADDRDGNSLLDPADDVPIGAGSVHLLAGAAVDAHGGGSVFLHDLSKFHRIDRIGIPALAEFHGDGKIHRRGNSLDDSACQRRVLHQGAASAVSCHLGCGTAHIDVDDVRVKAQGQLGCLCHDFGVISENLDSGRAFLFGEGQQLLGLGALKGQPLGAGHLCHNVCTVKLFADFTEGAVANTCHRRKSGCFGNGDIAYFQAGLSFLVQVQSLQKTDGPQSDPPKQNHFIRFFG